MKQLLTLLLLFVLCLLSYALSAQASFTRYYGAGSDNAQEHGLTVVPVANDQVMVIGLAQTIPDGANGLSFHYLDRQSGEQNERHYLPRRVSEITARAFTDREGNVALLNRLGTDSLSIDFFAGTHVPSWRVEVKRSLFNVNGAVTLLPDQSALLLHEPTTGIAGRSSELVCFGANGNQLWTREVIAANDGSYFVKVIAGPDGGHPVVLIASAEGISLSSYDRGTGAPRWERSLDDVAGQTYPLAIKLVADDVNDRILLVGGKSEGGFESDVITRLEAFSATGISLFENAISTDRYGIGGELLVDEDGSMLALQRCRLQRWLDYSVDAASPETTTGFCGDVDLNGLVDVSYLRRGEMFVTGALADESNFDRDLIALKASEQSVTWVFSDGLPGLQDADFAISSAPVPDEGGFYLLASTSLPDARYQARLLKTDRLGEIAWQRDFVPSEGEYGYARGLLVLADGGVMVQYSDGRQSHLAIVESDGELRWDNATTDDYVSTHFRDINLVQLADGSIVTHRSTDRGISSSELGLNRYSLTGELLDEWVVNGFTYRDPLTGMKLTSGGKLLLLGRPNSELSTVRIWQFDPVTQSVDWKWETGSFNTGAKEVNDVVELPNGNLVAALEINEYTPDGEVIHRLRLVEIDENGAEVRTVPHLTAPANILQHLEMALTEEGKILVLTAGGVENPEVAVSRYDPVDLSEEFNASFYLEDAGSMWLAGAAYLGRGYVQFYGETYVEAERQGEQLFLTVFNLKELGNPTSITDAQAETDLSVSPNPTSGLVWLAAKEKPVTKPVRVGVYSAAGQLVREFPISGLRVSPQSIDLSGLPAGIYALRLSGGIQATYKVVVQ